GRRGGPFRREGVANVSVVEGTCRLYLMRLGPHPQARPLVSLRSLAAPYGGGANNRVAIRRLGESRPSAWTTTPGCTARRPAGSGEDLGATHTRCRPRS